MKKTPGSLGGGDKDHNLMPGGELGRGKPGGNRDDKSFHRTGGQEGGQGLTPRTEGGGRDPTPGRGGGDGSVPRQPGNGDPVPRAASPVEEDTPRSDEEGDSGGLSASTSIEQSQSSGDGDRPVPEDSASTSSGQESEEEDGIPGGEGPQQVVEQRRAELVSAQTAVEENARQVRQEEAEFATAQREENEVRATVAESTRLMNESRDRLIRT